MHAIKVGDLADLVDLASMATERDDEAEPRLHWFEATGDEDFAVRLSDIALDERLQERASRDRCMDAQVGPSGSGVDDRGASAEVVASARAKVAFTDRATSPLLWLSARLEAAPVLAIAGHLGEALALATQAVTIARTVNNKTASSRAAKIVRRIEMCRQIRETRDASGVTADPAHDEGRPVARGELAPREIRSARPTVFEDRHHEPIDILMDPCTVSSVFRAWSKLTDNGLVEDCILPNMWDRHMAAAADACRRSLGRPEATHAPLSTVLHAFFAIEAFTNMLTVFVSISGMERWKGFEIDESLLGDPTKRVADPLSCRWRKLKRTYLFGSSTDFRHARVKERWANLDREMLFLIGLRNILVHPDMRLGERTGAGRTELEQMLLKTPSFVELGPEHLPAIERLLTPSLAVWSLRLAERVRDEFQFAWVRAEGRPPVPDKDGGGGATDETPSGNSRMPDGVAAA